MSNDVTTYLKYANLQMAAEALWNRPDPEGVIGQLKFGNNRASKFTQPQAEQFIADGWTVVEHQANQPTGFSGTLFKNTNTSELVLSFRSTEFADDAARDNQATNGMEIRPFGWAFGQIDDMKKWVDGLYANNQITNGAWLSVTGYSLGGHLAAAFNLLYQDQASATYTFNGAGIGKFKSGNNPVDVFSEFHSRRVTGANADLFTASTEVSADYVRLKDKFKGTSSSLTLPQVDTELSYLDQKLALYATGDQDVRFQYQTLRTAVQRVRDVAAEALRIADGLPSGGSGSNATKVTLNNIAATALDYQLAVLTVGKKTESYGDLNAVAKSDGTLSRTTYNRSNVFDIYGDTSPSMVANSQGHLGVGTPVWIEDQPTLRGSTYKAIWDASSYATGVKLLTENFSQNDFGDTHSLVLLVDSLSVQNVLKRLGPATDIAALKSILKSASNATADTGFVIDVGTNNQGKADGDTLEKVVNALGTYLALDKVAGNGWKKLKGDPTGGTWAFTQQSDYKDGNPDNYTTRADLQKNLDIIAKDTAGYQTLIGKLSVTPAGASLASNAIARTSFADVVALQALSPFVLGGLDADGKAALESLWQSQNWNAQYQGWKADKDAIAAGGKASYFTDAYLTDRAAMLQWQMEINKENAPATSASPYAPENALGLTAVPSQYFSDLASDKELYLGGPDRRRFVFGTDQADPIEGGGYSDRLYGGADNDTLDGKGANDYLEGGTGEDTYQFSGTWGKDIVCDTDGKGRLTIEGLALGVATANGERNQWIAKTSPTAFYVLTVVDDARSSTGKALTITSALNTSNSITIQNFDLTEAKKPTGYLGVMLEPTVKVATTGNSLPAGQSNFFNQLGADASSLAGQASNVVEGTGKTISVYLSQAAQAGETAVLNMQNLASAGMKAILGDSVVDANGATITLVEGQTEIRFALIQDGAISSDVSGSVSVTYNGTGGSVTSNAWGVNLKDAGAASKTYNGDQRAPLNGSNYDWSATSWASNGTLNGGVAEPGFSDVIRGAADNDTISGLGGNDALDGGAGNDTIDGGTGDDLIGGGAGSDSIRGGDGNDFINTSATLNMGGRVSPTDSWSPPSGQAVITQGARWGIYKDTMPDGTPVTVWGGSNSPAGNEADVVDAGAGNDQVIASGGDDRVQGGLGDDQLDGMGGNDVLEGGDGKDSINGDGRIQTGFLDSVAAPYHGADFVDGGAGDDNLRGGGGNDVVYGGADNDSMWGDDVGKASDAGYLDPAYHGADYLDGEDGDDTYVVDNVGDVIVDALGIATTSVATYARQTGVNGRFGCKCQRVPSTQRLRWHAQGPTLQIPHARSMRPAGQKGPGRLMDIAWRVL